MGQQQIVVDEGNLRAQGRSLESVGADFQDAASRLRSRLQTLEGGSEPPWGDDDLGEKFGVVYEGLRDGMQESMDSLAQRLGEMGQKLQVMADSHEANEIATAGGLDAVGGRTDALGGEIRSLHHPRA
ncbi:WXG100 family type VII secretion target [Kitasatospora sp. NPDC059571]|uniref:WXG100 family type VII secretion target n=1 Tax=Kitasatospora sp. NPDC059571 TaxID=3346871 RepID=UPI0036BB9C25